VLNRMYGRDVRNGFFKFGSVLRKTVGSVRFPFQFDFEKNRRFGFLCRSLVKYKKRVSCLSCVCILRFSKCSVGLKRMFF